MNISNTAEKEIRLLVVDDSAFMRQLIKDLLSAHKNIKIDTASNGKAAFQKLKEFEPHVMTLDVEMPLMTGIELLEKIEDENIFIPTIMLSRFTQKEGETTMKALELGAIDFIPKPEDRLTSIDFEKLSHDLYEKITISSQVTKSTLPPHAVRKTVKVKNTFIIPKLVVIGASTGGPGALYDIFSRLSKVNIPFLVVQHMPAGFTTSFAKRLNDKSEMLVKIAEEGEPIKPATVYIAPGDYHMTVSPDFTISLNQSPTVKGVRPSIDVTLNSAIAASNGRVLSVILTGMGNDGCDAVKELKKLGGKCIVQDQSTCVVFGMPEAIIESNNADCVVPLNKIPEEIVYYLTNWN